MKILFLSPTVPFPLTDGGRIRVFNLLKQIATKSDVTLLALETQPTDAEGVAQLQQLGIQVHLVPNAPTLPRMSLGTLLKAFSDDNPSPLRATISPPIARSSGSWSRLKPLTSSIMRCFTRHSSIQKRACRVCFHNRTSILRSGGDSAVKPSIRFISSRIGRSNSHFNVMSGC